MYGLTLLLCSLKFIPLEAFKKPMGTIYTVQNLSILNFINRKGCPNSWEEPLWHVGEVIHYMQILSLVIAVVLYLVCMVVIVAKVCK